MRNIFQFISLNLSWVVSESLQCYATRVRTGVRRGKIGQEIKEAAFEPSAETALKGREVLL